jgi:hypothetical protein
MLGISDAVELTKKISELVKAGVTLGLQETIVELREAVLNAKDEVLRLREDNQTLRAQLSEKAAWDESAAKYELVSTPTGGTVWHTEGPPQHYACPTCFLGKKIIPLQHAGGASVYNKCPQCNAHYPIREHEPSPRTPRSSNRGGPNDWMRS